MVIGNLISLDFYCRNVDLYVTATSLKSDEFYFNKTIMMVSSTWHLGLKGNTYCLSRENLCHIQNHYFWWLNLFIFRSCWSLYFRFPLQFCPFVQLLKSLAGDEDSAAKVCYFLWKHCNNYCKICIRSNLDSGW